MPIIGDNPITNLKYHNLCTEEREPTHLKELFGLGLSFCLQDPLPKSQNVDKTMKRLRRDIRRKEYYASETEEEEHDDFDRKMPHIPSQWDPPTASKEVESRLDAFEAKLKSLHQGVMNQPKRYNLSKEVKKLLQEFKNQKELMAAVTDKNLGIALIPRSLYIQRAWEDHLRNRNTYQEIHPRFIRIERMRMKYLIGRFTTKCLCGEYTLSEQEMTFFRRLVENYSDKIISKFYLTLKVHKSPWKTRPVVATCGTIFAGISKWADFQLQKTIHLVPSRIHDFFHVKKQLEDLGELHPGTRLFTMDAVAMYTNIDTNHLIDVLGKFLELFKDELPDEYPTKLVIEAVSLVMRNNLFEFGDCIFKQLIGSAMGTPVAVQTATIYYAYHEITVLLPKFDRHLQYYGRFIDDAIGVWNDLDDPEAFGRFCEDVDNFGILRWEVEERCKQIDFLDLTIWINEENHIMTKTYRKPQNIYQYIPKKSAHPPGVGRAIIFGCMRRYRLQNSRRKDYLEQINLLYTHMKARGWPHHLLAEWIMKSADKLEHDLSLPQAETNKGKESDTTSNRRAFVHLQFHPYGLSRTQVRAAFDETCDNFRGTDAEIDQLTVAFSRPRNIRDELISARLHQVEGQEASTFRPIIP